MRFGFHIDHRTEVFKDLLFDCLHEGYTTAIPFIFDFVSELICNVRYSLSIY